MCVLLYHIRIGTANVLFTLISTYNDLYVTWYDYKLLGSFKYSSIEQDHHSSTSDVFSKKKKERR